MAVQRYETLKCSNCDGVDFTPIIELTWHPRLGTSQNMKGLVCLKCQRRADQQKMVTEIRLREKKRQIAALQTEMEEQMKS